MIVELLTYKVKPGTRNYIMEMVRTRIADELQQLGARLAGPWASPEDDETFIWMKGFADEHERAMTNHRFYGGALWEEGMADIIVPSLDNFTTTIIEMDERAIDWVR